jgi:hypothetical protein
LGASLGLKASPQAAAVGAISGAILGGLLGAASGCTIGTALGTALDEHVFNAYRCLDCGYTFNSPPRPPPTPSTD